MDGVDAEEVDPHLLRLQADDAEALLQDALRQLRPPQRPGAGVEEHVLADEALRQPIETLSVGVRGLPPMPETRTRSGPTSSSARC